MLNEVDGLNYYFDNFTFEHTMDLIRLLPEDESISLYQIEVVYYLFSQKRNKKSFKEGRSATYQDVIVFLRKYEALKNSERPIEEDSLKILNESVRYVLHQAVLNPENPYDNSDKGENALALREEQLKKDLEFIQILKKQSDLQIFNEKLTKVILFEASVHVIEKERPFLNAEEAQIRTRML